MSSGRLWAKLLVVYDFRHVFVGILPQDHHLQHRLARAVLLVVSICPTELWGPSYEQNTDRVGGMSRKALKFVAL